MVIQCPQCGKKYKVDPEKIPEKGAKISCPGCGHNFMVKKKKDKDKESAAAVTAKNPPCQMCGAPSTRVLRGNPPQVLCDACFEREKEKTRRFSHIKPSVEEMIPPMPPAPAGAEAAEEKPAPGTQDRFEVKPEGEHEFEPEPETGEAPEVESKETEYFDSFAEIPDLEDAEAKPGTAEGKTLQEELQQLENIEPPVFDETGFDAPIKTKEIPKPEKASGPLAPPPAPARPTEDRASASDEYVFSPKEINRLEDTTGPQPEPRFRREDLSPPPQAAFPESGAGLRESSLDREIFGELAAQKGIAAEPGPALKKTRFFRMPRVPVKTAVSIGVILLVLIAGYFLFTSESVRNSLSKISARPEPGTEPVAV